MANGFSTPTPIAAKASAASAPWQLIPTRVHGILDYAMGLLLIVLPFLPGFPRLGGNGIETWLPIVLGAGALVYSLLTNYELGLFKALPMPLHLGLDFMSGALLAASPWLFGFHDTVYLPHLLLGLAEVGAALLTKTRPGDLSTGPRAGSLPSVLF